MAIKLTKNTDLDKCSNFGYGISFDTHGSFSLLYGGIGKNVIIFGADMSSYGYIDNKMTDILILGNGPTQGLDNNMLTAEADNYWKA